MSKKASPSGRRKSTSASARKKAAGKKPAARKAAARPAKKKTARAKPAAKSAPRKKAPKAAKKAPAARKKRAARTTATRKAPAKTAPKRKAAAKAAPKQKAPAKKTARRKAPAARPAAATTTPPAASAPPAAVPRREPGDVYLDHGPELPRSYGEDHVVALLRDPEGVFVYWEADGPESRRLKESLADKAFWVLRVWHDARRGHYDVPINLDAGNWYLHLRADGLYEIELGAIDAGEVFHLVASASPVKTPSRLPRDKGGVYWLDVLRAGRGKHISVLSESPYGQPSGEFTKARREMAGRQPLGYGASRDAFASRRDKE